MSERKAIGIDLGTTFSAAAHIDAYGKPQIIPNSESERITPSVILFDGETAIVGTLAKLLAGNAGAQRGLISVCAAGGMGVTAILER